MDTNYAPRVPHCWAIASAIPGYVRLRFFQRSALGASFQTLPSRPSTIFVGFNNGRFLSQRQLAFVSPCPNCHGWIICVYLPMNFLAYLCGIGFSMAIFGIGAFCNWLKKWQDKYMSRQRFPTPSIASQRTPLFVKKVHGGWAIIKSQPSPKCGRTSSLICWPLISVSRKSQLQASCPLRRKASRTIPLNSHAIKTRNHSRTKNPRHGLS